MLAAPSYRVIDCCEPTDCPCAWSRRLEHLPAGVGCMTCHRAAAPSPPPLPASKMALQQPSARMVAVDTTYILCGINKAPTRPAYSNVMIVPGTARFPVFSSREANWEFSTANLLHYYQPGIQAFPWTLLLKLLHSFHGRFLAHSFTAPYRIASRHSGGWGRSSITLIPAHPLASSHSLCAAFRLLQSSQAQANLQTFLTYQS